MSMKQRIKSAILAILIALTGSLVMVPAIASAGFKSDACEGVDYLERERWAGCDANAGNKVGKLMKSIVDPVYHRRFHRGRHGHRGRYEVYHCQR